MADSSCNKNDTSCLLCDNDADDPVNYGQKLCVDKTIAHHFCLVSNCLFFFSFVVRMFMGDNIKSINFVLQLLSASLVSNGDEGNGLMGFLPVDIQKEKKRGAKLT